MDNINTFKFNALYNNIFPDWYKEIDRMIFHSKASKRTLDFRPLYTVANHMLQIISTRVVQ